MFKRQREIWNRLAELDNILLEAANTYHRAADAASEEKKALIQEREKLKEEELKMVGKYSPTVAAAYAKDQNWWEKNGGESERGDHGFFYDVDGYDQYGYDKNEVDRAGHTENEYASDFETLEDGDVVYPIYEHVYFSFGVDENGNPAKIK